MWLIASQIKKQRKHNSTLLSVCQLSRALIYKNHACSSCPTPNQYIPCQPKNERYWSNMYVNLCTPSRRSVVDSESRYLKISAFSEILCSLQASRISCVAKCNTWFCLTGSLPFHSLMLYQKSSPAAASLLFSTLIKIQAMESHSSHYQMLLILSFVSAFIKFRVEKKSQLS